MFTLTFTSKLIRSIQIPMRMFTRVAVNSLHVVLTVAFTRHIVTVVVVSGYRAGGVTFAPYLVYYVH